MKRERLTLTSMLLGVIVLCGCTSSQEKLYKACEYYNTHGYEVMSSTENFKDGDKRFLIVRKNDTIYLDTLFKKNGESARKVFPNEKGIRLKTLRVDFKNDINGIMEPVNANDSHYSLKKINDIRIFFHNKNDSNGKDLLLMSLDGKTIYYYIGGEEGLVLNTMETKSNYPILLCEETFAFTDLYNDDSMPNMQNYYFKILEEFSLIDFSFIKLSSLKYEKLYYPWSLINERLCRTTWLTEEGNYFYTPVGYTYTDQIKEIIALDFEIKEEEARLEQERFQEAQREAQRQQEEAERQRQEEMTRQNILNNAIDFNDMLKDYNNPIKAEKKYNIGEDILLKIRIDKIENYSYGGYTYIMSWLGRFTIDAFLYSNDKSFEELDYPQIVWVKAKYNSRHEAWDSKVTYQFTDAQLLLWKKPGLLE